MSLDLGSAMGRIIINAQDALDQTGKVGKALGGLAGPAALAGGAVVAAGAAAGGALIALGASSVGVAREFESSMAVMSTAVDPLSVGAQTTAEAMSILGDASLAVGSDTDLVGVSASSASEAMTGLYKAGLSTGEIFGDLQGYLAGTADLGGALRASIDLAAASELDMVQASELAAVTLATFGGHLETEAERAEFINTAMNNFVQTADASVAGVGDLSQALINVGPAAASFGIPLEDVNTALGILSTRGITGAEAGTNLKSMLLNMMSGTKPVTKAMAELGISLYDLEGNMYTLPQIMSQVEQSLSGLTEEQQNQYIKTLAGNYGISSMTALLAEGGQGWIDMQAAIGEAATMQETAAARTQTLAGAQEALSGVWESFQIKVGTALIPVLTTLADVGARLLEKYGPTLTAAFEAFGNGVGRIIEVLTGGNLGELFTVFEDGSSTLGSIFEAFGMGEERANALGASISNLVTRVQEFLAPIANAVTSFVSFKDVLVGLGIAVAAAVIPAIISLIAAMAPILLTVGAIIGVVALLRNAWENNWGDIQGKAAAAWDFIRPILESIKEWIVGTVIPAVQELWQKWVTVWWPAIQQKLQDAWAAIQPIFAAIKEFITGTVIPAVQQLWKTWTEEVWPTIQTVTENVWTIVKAIFEELGRWINDNIVPWIEFLHDVWVNDVWPAIQGAIETAWDIIEPIWEAIREWAAETIPPIIEALQGIFEGVMSGISAAIQPVKDVWDGLVGAVQGFWDWIKGKVFDFKISLPDLPDWAVPGSPLPIHTAWAEFADDMAQIGRDISDGLLTAFETIPDATEALDALFETTGNLASLGGNFAGEFRRQTLDPLAAAVGQVGADIDRYSESIAGMVEALGYEEGFERRPDAILELMRRADYQYATDEERATARVLLSFLEQRRRLMLEQIELQEEFNRQQERLARLERQRSEIAFLQQQLDLLKLIRDNGLSTNILDGLVLGINADPGALMDAMASAMRQMIRAAEHELGIASPSAVFRRIAEQAKQGLIVGLSDSRAVVRAARGMVAGMVESAELALERAGVGAGLAGAAAGDQRMTLYGGQHFYFQQRRGSVLEEVQGLLRP